MIKKQMSYMIMICVMSLSVVSCGTDYFGTYTVDEDDAVKWYMSTLDDVKRKTLNEKIDLMSEKEMSDWKNEISQKIPSYVIRKDSSIFIGSDINGFIRKTYTKTAENTLVLDKTNEASTGGESVPGEIIVKSGGKYIQTKNATGFIFTFHKVNPVKRDDSLGDIPNISKDLIRKGKETAKGAVNAGFLNFVSGNSDNDDKIREGKAYGELANKKLIAEFGDGAEIPAVSDLPTFILIDDSVSAYQIDWLFPFGEPKIYFKIRFASGPVFPAKAQLLDKNGTILDEKKLTPPKTTVGWFGFVSKDPAGLMKFDAPAHKLNGLAKVRFVK